MHMDADYREMMNALLDTPNTLPAARCARIFRGLAGVTADPTDRSELNDLARRFSELDDHCRAFKFRFNQKNP